MDLKVFSRWFHEQALEEQGHAMKMAKYLMDQDARVQLKSLDQPETEFSSVEQIAQMALDHEKWVTQKINELASIARKENDFATENFMQWFVQEQVEEVATASELVALVKMATDPGQMLVVEDRIMALRGASGEKTQ
jgi:ferritin